MGMDMSAAIPRSVMLFEAAAAVLLSVFGAAAAVAAAEGAPDGCTRNCGNISIPFPFGVEPRCYVEAGFNLTCDRSHRPPKLFLGDGTVQVLKISVSDSRISIGPKPVTAGTWSGALSDGGPYTLTEQSQLLVMGCNVEVQVLLVGEESSEGPVGSCSAVCSWRPDRNAWYYTVTGICPGVACCLSNLMTGRSSYRFNLLRVNGAAGPNSSAVAWIMEKPGGLDIYSKPLDDNDYPQPLPVVLDWRINHTTCHGNASSATCRSGHSFCKNITQSVDTMQVQHGHLCHCDPGYQGNPYVPNGCHDVNECEDPERYPCYGVCSNTEGGYKCKCLPGYEGNASVPNGCKGKVYMTE
ncbi:hypothetical protein EJB05_48435, partial [Eragrostis curvula]